MDDFEHHKKTQDWSNISMAEWAEMQLEDLCQWHDDMMERGLLDEKPTKEGIPCT